MTNSLQKIDYSSINSIIDKIASVVYKALPHPIFKWHSIVAAARLFGSLSFIIFLIGLTLTIISAVRYRNKTLLVITKYENGEVTKTKSRILDQIPDGKCRRIDDEVTGERKYKKCNKAVRYWFRYLIFTIVATILPLFFIMPLANFTHFRKKYFANPQHNTTVDYLLRIFYPLKWGDVWNNNRYDDMRKNNYLKALYGTKKD